MEKKKINIKHKVYDSVFADYFTFEDNLKKLYKILLGENAREDIKREEIEILNIDKVFVDDLYNDLCFKVDDELIVLVEAQSTYTKNIVTRLLFYVAKDVERYIRTKSKNNKLTDLYKEKAFILPKIKLYTVYTGKKVLKDHYIKLTDLMVKDKIESDIELKVKVICQVDEDNILSEYMKFCRVLREQKKKLGNTVEAIEKTIEICQDKGILKKYLEERKHEVKDMVSEFITTEDWVEDVRNESISIGKVEGMLILGASSKQITELTGATEEEIEEIRKNMK